MDEVKAVVMESNGQFSVLRNGSLNDAESSLYNVAEIHGD